MNLTTLCKSCRSEIKVKVKQKNRYELSKKVGNYLTIYCAKCSTEHSYHLNRCKAKVPFIFKLIFPVALILSLLLVFYLWDIGTRINSYQLIPVGLVIINLITTAISFSITEKVRYFNAYYVK